MYLHSNRLPLLQIQFTHLNLDAAPAGPSGQIKIMACTDLEQRR